MLLGVEVRARLNIELRQKLANLTKTRLDSPLRDIRSHFATQIAKGQPIDRCLFTQILNSVGLFMKCYEEQTYFNFIDKDRNGEISFQDFFAFLNTPLKDRRLAAVEQAWDKLNQNGVIDLSQIANKLDLFPLQVYLDHKIIIDTHKLLKYYREAFLARDGKVDHALWLQYHEDLGARYVDDSTFIAIVRKLYFMTVDKMEPVTKAMLQQGIKAFRYKIIQSTANAHDEMKLAELFFKFDEGQKKYLSKNDLQAMSIILKADLKQGVLEVLFQRFDANRDGQISFKEFKDFILMKEYPS